MEDDVERYKISYETKLTDLVIVKPNAKSVWVNSKFVEQALELMDVMTYNGLCVLQVASVANCKRFLIRKGAVSVKL